jgi:hypothetical protein
MDTMDTSSPSPLTPSDGVSDEVCADATSGVTALYQAHADGSVIIGSQVWAGHERFGIFRGGNFTPLPALSPRSRRCPYPCRCRPE